MNTRIVTDEVYKQVMDTCYQEILCSVFAWHEIGPRDVIPGYWKTQHSLWNLPDTLYRQLKSKLDEKSFNWAIALAGAENDLEREMVNRFYEDDKNSIRYWGRVKQLINKGKIKIQELSKDDHLGLIRHFNPDFKPIPLNLECPAGLSLALRRFGPLFAAGKFGEDEERPGYIHEHTIMITGIIYAQNTYFIEFKDGLKKGIQYLDYNIFCKNLAQDSSAILYCDSGNQQKFATQGERAPGTLFKFCIRDERLLNEFSFKEASQPLQNYVYLPGNQMKVTANEDLSDLEPEPNVVYTVTQDPYNFESLNTLPLVFCADPQDALKFLEVNCLNVNRPKPSLLSPLKRSGNKIENKEQSPLKRSRHNP